METMDIVCAVLVVFTLIFLWKSCVRVVKIDFYERLLTFHKEKFSTKEWEEIEVFMDIDSRNNDEDKEVTEIRSFSDELDKIWENPDHTSDSFFEAIVELHESVSDKNINSEGDVMEYTEEDMIDFATDQKNRGLEPDQDTLKAWIKYR